MDDLKIIPYRARLYKWPRPARVHFKDDDELYDWMVNDWIPSQPDSSDLIALFIRLKFCLNEFIITVGPKPGGGSRKRKAA